MNGIILAAGRGSRMGSLTDAQPKCLTKLGSKTLLTWQLEALTTYDVDSIAVVTGYQADKLQDSRYMTFHNPRWAETNMVMSLMAADSWLKVGPCIVSYADIVYHPNIVKKLCLAKGDLVITYDRLWHSLWTKRFTNPLSDAETFITDEQGQLLSIGQQAQSIDEIQGQYMGLLKFSPTAWLKVTRFLSGLSSQERNKMDMTGLLNKLLERGMRIQTVAIDGKWCEVDSASDLAIYEDAIQQTTSWEHDWRF